jgi:hypothetical protein
MLSKEPKPPAAITKVPWLDAEPQGGFGLKILVGKLFGEQHLWKTKPRLHGTDDAEAFVLQSFSKHCTFEESQDRLS